MQPTFAIFSTKTLNLKGNFLSFLTDTEKKTFEVDSRETTAAAKNILNPEIVFLFLLLLSGMHCHEASGRRL